MASRRIVPADPTLEKDAVSPVTGDSSGPSNTTPAVPFPVVAKLLAFTIAMVTVPIGTYFAVNSATGHSTAAGAAAAFMANVVLIGYVIVAFMEDQSDRQEAEQKAKKSE